MTAQVGASLSASRASLPLLAGHPQVQQLAHALREDTAFRGQHDLVRAPLQRVDACGHPAEPRLVRARGVPDVQYLARHDALADARTLRVIVDAAALVGRDEQKRLDMAEGRYPCAL